MSDVLDLSVIGAWLEANVEGFRGPFKLKKFPGGQSNPTYKIDAQSGSYVLRRKPFGELLPSAHAVEREHRLISTIWPLEFPVPRPLALCTDTSVIGSVFYIMSFARGHNFWNGALPDLDNGARRAVYESMIKTLAKLHNIDVAAAGLEDYGPRDNYFERQIKRWTKQYRNSQTEEIESIERLIDWLPATVPAQSHLSIVHGDYRIDNLIFGQDHKVEAVLDWELSTLGDPIADFSYLTLQWVLPHEGNAALGGLNLKDINIPDLGEAIELYCETTNRRQLPDLDWYFAYNLFRIAGIVQGIRKRIDDGTASHARAYETASRVSFFAQFGFEFALKAQAKDKLRSI